MQRHENKIKFLSLLDKTVGYALKDLNIKKRGDILKPSNTVTGGYTVKRAFFAPTIIKQFPECPHVVTHAAAVTGCRHTRDFLLEVSAWQK